MTMVKKEEQLTCGLRPETHRTLVNARHFDLALDTFGKLLRQAMFDNEDRFYGDEWSLLASAARGKSFDSRIDPRIQLIEGFDDGREEIRLTREISHLTDIEAWAVIWTIGRYWEHFGEFDHLREDWWRLDWQPKPTLLTDEYLNEFRSRTEQQWAKLPPDCFGWQQGTKWNPGLSNEQISSFEEEFEVKLPPALRLFLQHTNGTDKQIRRANSPAEPPEGKYFRIRFFSYPRDLTKMKQAIGIAECGDTDELKLPPDTKFIPLSASSFVACSQTALNFGRLELQTRKR